MLAAFINGEQRGLVKALEIPGPLGGGYGFLMLIYSNQAEGEKCKELIAVIPRLISGD